MTDLMAERIISGFSAMLPKKPMRNVIVAAGRSFAVEELRAQADQMQESRDSVYRETGDLLHVLIDAADEAKAQRELAEAKLHVKDMQDDVAHVAARMKKLLATVHDKLDVQERQQLVDAIDELEATIA